MIPPFSSGRITVFSRSTQTAPLPILFRYRAGLPAFNFSHILNFYKQASRPAEDISEATGLRYLHRENYFQEFNRDRSFPLAFY